MVDEFFKQGKKARDEKKMNQIMEKMKVNLFEGQLDEHGNYIPAKFELLTYPAYYKIMSLQPELRPENWQELIMMPAKQRAKAKQNKVS